MTFCILKLLFTGPMHLIRSNNSLSRPKVLLVSTTMTNTGIRIAKELSDAGCEVVMHCSQNSLATTLATVRTIHPTRGQRIDRAVLRSLRREKPQLVIPCDDDTVRALHALYHAHSEWQPLLESSLGAPVSFAAVASRAGLMHSLADVHGLHLPPWSVIRSHPDLHPWEEEMDTRAFVLKLENSDGGFGVNIVRDRRHAGSVLTNLTYRPRGVILIGRRAYDYVFNLHTCARLSAPMHTIAQQYISGRPANAAIFCEKGEVLAYLGFEVLESASEVTPSSVIRSTDHPGMEDAVRTIARHLGLSGFHGLDFVIEDGTSIAWLLELNPRVTPSAHLPMGTGHDLIVACLSRLIPESNYTRRPIAQQVVALFPRQFAVAPDSDYLQTAYHDVDWSEPDLILGQIKRLQQTDSFGRCSRIAKWGRSLFVRKPKPVPPHDVELHQLKRKETRAI